MAAIRWLAETATDDGITERPFHLDRPSGRVPGVLWLPSSPAPGYPVVLLGHGGSGHKRSERILFLARWFCRAGLAPLAIDGPYHGDRVTAPMSAADYQARIVAEGLDVVIDRVVDDWLVTLGAIESATEADTSRVGYVGVSMGARFGLPLAAAMGCQLRCAVLGKFGLEETTGMYRGTDPAVRIRRDAEQITAPVVFLLSGNLYCGVILLDRPKLKFQVALNHVLDVPTYGQL